MGSSQPIRVLDIFSGAGGMSLGWLQAFPGRSRIVAAIDGDASLTDVQAWNFPGTAFLEYRFSDDTRIDHALAALRQLRLERGAIDVVVAGPPCQSMSTAGKRRDHPDNRLAFRVCDIVAELRPKVVVIENVPEFGRIHEGRLLGRVRVQLARSGYATEAVVINAMAFGVPQLRLRCFVVGVAKERAPHPFVSPLRWRATHVAINSHRLSLGPAMSKETQLRLPHCEVLPLPPTVDDAIGDLPALAAGEGSEEAIHTRPPISPYQALLRGDELSLYNHVAVNHSPTLVAAIATLGPGQTPQSMTSHALRKKDYFRSAYARLDPYGVAPTMTTQTHNPGSGRFTHYRDDRVLTVREVARLQSFPDRFRFFGSMETQRRHVGNAVPPLLAQAVAESLQEFVND